MLDVSPGIKFTISITRRRNPPQSLKLLFCLLRPRKRLITRLAMLSLLLLLHTKFISHSHDVVQREHLNPRQMISL
jgi:hypothetical protein